MTVQQMGTLGVLNTIKKKLQPDSYCFYDENSGKAEAKSENKLLQSKFYTILLVIWMRI
jgi:hypothetical protein